MPERKWFKCRRCGVEILSTVLDQDLDVALEIIEPSDPIPPREKFVPYECIVCRAVADAGA
jgi:hypothetical protein